MLLSLAMHVMEDMTVHFAQAIAPIAIKAGLQLTEISGPLIRLHAVVCLSKVLLRLTPLASLLPTHKLVFVTLTAKNVAGAGQPMTLSSGSQTN